MALSSLVDIVAHRNDIHRIDKYLCLVPGSQPHRHPSMSVRLRRTLMSRIQLALRVADLEAAVDFYTRLFDTPPAKRRPGYAHFAVAEPPLKLVLLEGAR